MTPTTTLIRARRRGIPGWLDVKSRRFLPIIAGGAPKLDELRKRRDDASADMERAYNALEAASAGSPEASRAQREFDAADAAHDDAVKAYERAAKMAEARSHALSPENPRVTGEPATYSRHDKRSSYFLDVARVALLEKGHATPDADGARDRLQRHERDVREYAQRHERQAEQRMSDELEQLLGGLPDHLADEVRRRGMVERRDLTRVDGAGGHFVPPIWLMEEYAGIPRASRPFVEACRVLDMPLGTDSLNIPRITTGSLTAPQTADNAAVAEQDMVDAVVTAPVRTIAGQQDVAMQLLDQSPLAFDEVVFADLLADYYFRCEDQAINGTGASGQVLGVLNTSGVNAVSYTDASPTLPELWVVLGQSLSVARTARKRRISHGWMASRRQFWLTSQLDANSRPFITPGPAGPHNALGSFGQAGGPDEDPPLQLHNTSHHVTDAMPLNLGAGTNEDRVIHTRNSEHLFFESHIRARALPEVLSSTLTVRLQVYSYIAFTAGRYPAATSVISGTGLVAPAGF